MSLTFYYSPMSTASVTHLVLEELGVPYEKVLVDIKTGDQKKPAFLQINPNAKVPAIVHEGVAIFESVAISIYLGETFGVDKGLFPAAGPARGEALKWLVWCGVSLGEAMMRRQRHLSEWFPAEQRNAAAGAVGQADVERHLGILNDALTGKEYLVGNQFTIVDAHLTSLVGYLGMIGFDLSKYPAITAWHKKCGARPAAARVMAG
jgi:glutathione S-transferase